MASKRKIPMNRFELIVELASEGILTLDAGGLIDYINGRGAAILCYRPEEMIGRKPSDFLLPEDKLEARAMLREGEAEHIEVPARRKDDSTVWVSLSITPILGDDNTYQGSAGIFSDITDRKLAEEASAFQTHLLASVHDAIIAADGDLRIIYWNEMAERMLGWSAEEAFGNTASELLRPRVPGSTVEEVMGRLLSDGFLDGEAIAHHRDGREIWVDVHTSVIRSRSGELREIVATLRDITDRKRAEEALRRSEEGYRHLVQYAPTAIFELDFASTRFKSVNDAMSELTGYSREELLSMNPLDFLDSEERERFRKRVAERLIGVRGNESVEYRVRVKDGRELWAVFILKPIYENGKVTGALVIGHDDTAQRETREALKRSEGRLRMILDNSSDGIYMVDLGSGRFIFTSPSMHEITGLSQEEMSGLTAEEARFRIHPDDQEEVLAHQRRMMEGTDSGEPIEYRWMAISGEYRWLSDRRKLVRDEHGRPVAAVGTSRDITDRKQWEQALHRSEERLRLALSAGHLGTWDWNVTTDESIWNDEAYRILGFRIGEVVPSFGTWLSRVHPEDQAGMRDKVMSAFRTGGDFAIDFRVLWPDGTVRWVSALGEVELDGEGRPFRTLGVLIDSTERKMVEKELIRYAEELERSNAELQQFAYVASHDLQEPLRMVTLYMDLLNKRHGAELSPEASVYMSIAMDGAERMKMLVNDLLEYSRVETRVQAFEPVDMGRMAASVKEGLRIAIYEAGAEVRVGELPTVVADEMQMRQLLTNLVSNAIKFRRVSAPLVEIYACDGGNEWLFAVQDNGIGIDPKHLDKLFKMFSRLQSREEYPGTGIGLAICKKIVERHGGHIWAESDGRSGSTFIFTLPKMDDEQVPSSSSPPSCAPRSARGVNSTEGQL